MDNKEDLIDELVLIVKDYRNVNFDNLHVQRWLEQFQDNQHKVLLRNLVSILEQTYYSKSKIEFFFRKVFQSNSLFLEPIENYTFLDIQTRGSSQKEILEIITEQCYNILRKKIKKSNFNTFNNYIYADDAIYSGNRLKWDIINWANSIPDANAQINLLIIVIGIHYRNLDYILEEIKKKLPNANINYCCDISFTDHNKLFLRKYEGYLPPNSNYSQISKDYINSIDTLRNPRQIKYYPLLRDMDGSLKDTYFLSLQERNIVEEIFLEKGVKIMQTATSKNFRPMGYDINNTLGFGSYLVTYRNIANNCPLVLWWGDLNGHESISNWYPLFPRTVNETRWE